MVRHRSEEPPLLRHRFEPDGGGERPGTCSSSSVASSPRRRSLPPPWAHSALPGVGSTSTRGIWPGIGLRFGLSAGVSSGWRSFAVIAKTAISVVSSADCNCSDVSEGEEDQKSIRGIDFPTNPKRWARWPAN